MVDTIKGIGAAERGFETVSKLAAEGIERGGATKLAHAIGFETLPKAGDAATKAARSSGVARGGKETLLNPVSSLNPLQLTSSLSNTASIGSIFLAPIVATVSNWKWVQRIPVMGKYFKASGKIAALNDTQLGTLGSEASTAFRLAAEDVPGAKGALEWAAAASEKAHGSVAKYGQKTLGKSAFGAKAGKILSETTVSNGVFGGTIIAGEGATLLLTTGRRLRILRQMQADLTGKVPSNWTVLMGNQLHPLVLGARKELMGKRATFGTLVQLSGMAGTAWMAIRNAHWGKQIGFGLGASLLGGMITAGDTALAAYDKLHQSFAQAGKAGVEDYAAVIGGLTKNANEKIVQKFARQCFEEQIKPPELLRRIVIFQKSLQANAANGPAGKPAPETLGIHTGRVKARRADQAAAAATGAANNVVPA